MYDRHDIELRDVAPPTDDRCPDDMDRGCLVVSYNAVHRPNASYTEGRHVSARLPVECLALFEDGTIDVADLDASEREWVRDASARYGNTIDFDGTETAA
jgi:hypothetical protein